jgi:hypothetical protein
VCYMDKSSVKMDGDKNSNKYRYIVNVINVTYEEMYLVYTKTCQITIFNRFNLNSPYFGHCPNVSPGCLENQLI